MLIKFCVYKEKKRKEHLFFSSSNGAERNSHDNDGYTPSNIAIFSLAIYSFPVPLRSVGAERNSDDGNRTGLYQFYLIQVGLCHQHEELLVQVWVVLL